MSSGDQFFKKCKVLTFGCRLNNSESQEIERYLRELDFCSVILINSCAVTSEAERQLRQTIRSVKKEHPDHLIVLTGCASNIDANKYLKMNEVDFIIDNQEKLEKRLYLRLKKLIHDGATKHIVKLESSDSMGKDEEYCKINNNLKNDFDFIATKITLPELPKISPLKRARAYIRVQNGCNHRCTFCIIPFGRGPSTSAPIGEIINQIQIAITNGVNEVVLTGVDITDYGSNIAGSPKLGSVIRRILALVPELKRIRLSSIDVAEIDEDLYFLIQNERRLMPNLHLSLQSGDDMILTRMKRRHSRAQALNFCKEMSAARMSALGQIIAFGCDLIAGFPTETEEMFENTCQFIIDANLLHLHVFPYSERAGTPAARMPQVPKEVRGKRARILRELGKKNLRSHYEAQIGKKLNVVIEGNGFGHAEDFSLCKLAQDCLDNHRIGEIIEFEPMFISENTNKGLFLV